MPRSCGSDLLIANSTSGYVLAFDFGLRYIGVAAGQTVTGTASPITTVRAHNGQPHWPELLALIEDWSPVKLLVGLPLNMDETESEMSARARAFAAALQNRAQLDTELVDERLTTREAAKAGGGHALAAALIAETWLNAQRL